MRGISTHILDTAKIVILAALIVLGVNYVFADWQPPQNSPPACPTGQPGCDPPVNEGGALQVKDGALGVRAFTADNTQINGTLDVLGSSAFSNISAVAGQFSGAVSGASLTATAGGAITGGSLNVGSGLVTAGDGANAAVAVGTNNNATRTYLKIDAENFSGTKPPASDCAGEADYGKMIFSFNQSYIYICGFDVVNSTPAWWYSPLTLQLP